jgi:hypothetical protein
MNLLQIRTKFRQLSGKFDLVNADFSDNGADFFINEGSKFLDRLSENQKSWASAFRFIEVGKYSASIQYCRAIKEVWAATTTARWQLEKKSLQELLNDHLLSTPSERTTGEPAYYSPTLTRYIPEDLSAEDFESFIQWVEIPSGDAHEYNTILLSAPTDQKLLVEIKGLFYSNALIADEDKNYWSVNHPFLLYMAAMRYVEVSNRNTQGVNDWDRAIAKDATDIGMDLVEELIADATEMEG